MASKREERKIALKKKLTDAAEERIARDGAASLRARDLAKDAGCAVGAIYNVFDDMNALVMEVNGRTFKRIGTRVSEAVDKSQPPVDQLIALSLAYLRFARDHTLLWRALFDLEMTTQSDVPEWYLNALKDLFAHIAVPVSMVFPDLGREDVGLMTRALFSSVHGIILLGLEERISGVPVEQVEDMIHKVLTQIGNK